VIEHTPLWAFTGQELALACSISGTETMPDDPMACAIIRALLDASADPTTGKWPFTPTRRKRTKRGRRRSDYSTDSSSDDEHHDNDHQDNINNDDDDDDEVERELAQELIAKSAAMSPIAADHYMSRPFALSKRTKAAITTVALSCLERQQTSDAFYLPRELLLMLAAYSNDAPIPGRCSTLNHDQRLASVFASEYSPSRSQSPVLMAISGAFSNAIDLLCEYGFNLSQVSQSQLEVFLMRGISNSRAADALKLMRCLLDHQVSVDPTNTGLALLRTILNTANLTDQPERRDTVVLLIDLFVPSPQQVLDTSSTRALEYLQQLLAIVIETDNSNFLRVAVSKAPQPWREALHLALTTHYAPIHATLLENYVPRMHALQVLVALAQLEIVPIDELQRLQHHDASVEWAQDCQALLAAPNTKATTTPLRIVSSVAVPYTQVNETLELAVEGPYSNLLPCFLRSGGNLSEYFDLSFPYTFAIDNLYPASHVATQPSTAGRVCISLWFHHLEYGYSHQAIPPWTLYIVELSDQMACTFEHFPADRPGTLVVSIYTNPEQLQYVERAQQLAHANNAKWLGVCCTSATNYDGIRVVMRNLLLTLVSSSSSSSSSGSSKKHGGGKKRCNVQ